MTGWKTKLGAAGVILGGLGTAIAGFLVGDWSQVGIGLTVAFGGLEGLGIGHKIEKAAS